MTGSRDSAEVTPESPWLGLHSFSEATEGYFFGRDDELRELFRRVEHKTLTIIFGKSGLGKTSLLHAGLIPRLRQAGYLPVPIRLGYAIEDPAPSVQVAGALQGALDAAGHKELAGFRSESVNLWELFHDPIHELVQPKGSAVVRPVLIFDQFEEIYTLGEQRRADVAAFQEALAELVENRAPPSLNQQILTDPELAERVVFEDTGCKVLISLREDFLSHLERWRSVMPSLMDNRFELRLLTGPKAAMAVFKPGTLRPGKPPIVSSETTAAIVRFVAGARADVPLAEIDAVPPLLSLICAEMNVQRLEAGQEEIDTDQLKDRSEDILQDFYDRSFAQAPKGFRELVEDQLLSPEGHRESLSFDTARERLVQTSSISSAEAERAIAALVDTRLLAIEERSGVRRVELTHDILSGIARTSRDRRREREAKEKLEKEKLEVQRVAEQQGRAIRRARMVAAAFVLLFLGALGALIWALTLKNQADNAEKKAVSARQSAEGVLEYLLYQLRDKLKPIGRLDIIEDMQKQIETYYKNLGFSQKDPNALNNWANLLQQEGDRLRAQGNLAGAKAKYDENFAIAQRLVKEAPENQTWQANLAYVYNRLGDALIAQGDLNGAKTQFASELEIIQKLLKQAPDNTVWLRESSVVYERIGDVLKAQGDLTGAKGQYTSEFEIFQKLTRQIPGNSEWQYGLAVSYEKLGEVLRAEGDLNGAKGQYTSEFEIFQKLTKQDPGNTAWQRSLAISYEKLGSVLSDQGDMNGAKAQYTSEFEILQKLAKQDPGNSDWQRGLSISYEKLGDVLRGGGDMNGAKAQYTSEFEILQKLAKQDPGNADWQRSLSISYEKLGYVSSGQGDLNGAKAQYTSEFEIFQKLAKQDPGNTDWQHGLSITHLKLGYLLETQKDTDGAKQHFNASVEILTSLIQVHGENPTWKSDLDWVKKQLSQMK